MALMGAKAFGADAIAITDIKRDNLDLAERLGADIALNPEAGMQPADVAAWLRAALPPRGPDIIIDCAGFESTLQVSLPPSICSSEWRALSLVQQLRSAL